MQTSLPAAPLSGRVRRAEPLPDVAPPDPFEAALCRATWLLAWLGFGGIESDAVIAMAREHRTFELCDLVADVDRPYLESLLPVDASWSSPEWDDVVSLAK